MYSLLLTFNLSPLQAGIFDETIGGRSTALGFTSITMHDFWSALNNQAGLASITNRRVGVFIENKFLLNSLSTKSFGIAQPFTYGSIGFKFIQFGETAYNETMLGLSYGLNLSANFSIGIEIFHYAINQTEEIGTAETFNFQGGFIYQQSDRLQIAFHIFSPRIFEKAKDELDLSEILKLGLSYELSETLQGFFEVQSHSKVGRGINSGIEFHSSNHLAFRVGYSSINEKFTFGLGLKIKKLAVDIASSMHRILGYSPQLSLTYEF